MNRDAGAGRKPPLGLVWNLSHGGVSLLPREPLAPGSSHQGERATTDAAALPVRLQVAHVRRLRTDDYFLAIHQGQAVQTATVGGGQGGDGRRPAPRQSGYRRHPGSGVGRWKCRT